MEIGNDQWELCFPQLANLSCRKSLLVSSEGILLRVFSGVLLPVICFFTVLLNLLVVITITHFRQLHTATNLLLLSLAGADLLIGLLMIPTQLYVASSCWLFSDFLCSFFILIMILSTCASVGNMVLISADRFVAICHPLHYNIKVTVKRIQVCICLCWLSAFVYSCMVINEQLLHPGKFNSCVGECIITIDYNAGVVDLLVSFLLPLSIILSLYSRVFVAAVTQARAMRSHVNCVKLRPVVPSLAKKAGLKAARSLGVLVLVFLVCFCPYYIVSFVQDSNEMSPLKTILLHLYFFNSCGNPLIYVLFYPWFRRALRHIISLHILHPTSQWRTIL